LTPTDTLVESVVRLVRQSPINILRLLFWLLKGRVAFKCAVAARSNFSAETLPYREDFLEYLYKEKRRGRRLILATASHKSVADDVSRHLGIFDCVIATEHDINLKGVNKLRAIKKKISGGFAYAGDSKADIPIWRSADAAILVETSPSVTKIVRSEIPVELEFRKTQTQLTICLRAIRLHQWLKNLLIFVPLLTAFSFFDKDKLIASVVAFVAFSLAASATYIVNDLWDLDSDRAHPRKRFRPLASGELSIISGVKIAGIFLLFAIVLAFIVSEQFLMMLFLYLFITSAYSYTLKQYVLIDVIVLSLLYTLRIFAGSVAIGVTTSTWLLAFSVFLFLSLALVKRCAELVSLEEVGKGASLGRDYRVSDLVVLWPLGVGAAVSAVVVFGLFISTPETTARYGSPFLLWFVALGLIYWLSRLWIKTARGEMHDDPVVYAVRDKGSRVVVFFMAAAMIIAHYFNIGVLL